MKIEDQNVSVELAQEMKKRGAEQDSLFWWAKHIKSGTNYRIWDLVFGKDENDLVNKYISAYSVAELGEMLPPDYNTSKSIKGSIIIWYCSNSEYSLDLYCEYANTEADARAKMWVFLKKNNCL